jgi:hypothetical protein
MVGMSTLLDLLDDDRLFEIGHDLPPGSARAARSVSDRAAR